MDKRLTAVGFIIGIALMTSGAFAQPERVSVGVFVDRYAREQAKLSIPPMPQSLCEPKGFNFRCYPEGLPTGADLLITLSNTHDQTISNANIAYNLGGHPNPGHFLIRIADNCFFAANSLGAQGLSQKTLTNALTLIQRTGIWVQRFGDVEIRLWQDDRTGSGSCRVQQVSP